MRHLGWLFALGLAGCAFTPASPPSQPASGRAVLFVIDRGWHTEIGVPVPDSENRLTAFRAIFPGARYLVFGFGERAFFTARNRDFGGMIRALLPSPSAMLVTALRDPPAAAFGAGNVVTLHLPQNAVNQVIAFIWEDFQRDPSDRPRLLAYGPYPGSLFFLSSGTYDALYTCNTWTAEALQAGGVRVRVFGTVFASQVMDQVRAADPGD